MDGLCNPADLNRPHDTLLAGERPPLPLRWTLRLGITRK